jgi:hypothetical protein
MPELARTAFDAGWSGGTSLTQTKAVNLVLEVRPELLATRVDP